MYFLPSIISFWLLSSYFTLKKYELNKYRSKITHTQLLVSLMLCSIYIAKFYYYADIVNMHFGIDLTVDE